MKKEFFKFFSVFLKTSIRTKTLETLCLQRDDNTIPSLTEGCVTSKQHIYYCVNCSFQYFQMNLVINYYSFDFQLSDSIDNFFSKSVKVEKNSFFHQIYLRKDRKPYELNFSKKEFFELRKCWAPERSYNVLKIWSKVDSNMDPDVFGLLLMYLKKETKYSRLQLDDTQRRSITFRIHLQNNSRSKFPFRYVPSMLKNSSFSDGICSSWYLDS